MTNRWAIQTETYRQTVKQMNRLTDRQAQGFSPPTESLQVKTLHAYMMDRWMMDYCRVFTKQPFHQKKGINFKWYRSLIELYCLKADTGMQISVVVV
jgi:hypothetical protein